MATPNKSNLRAILFLLPFAAVGIGFLIFLVFQVLLEGYEMRSWVPVEARVISTHLQENNDSDSDTHKAVAEYSYRYNGGIYGGNRINHVDMSDNIGTYHAEMAQMLERHQREGTPITVWVNPDDPSQSIVDRNIRWGMQAFYMVFVLTFGGVGVGGIVGLLLSARSTEVDDAINSPDKPWLARKEWSHSAITPDQQNERWSWFGIAIFWNLVSSPLLFVIHRELEKHNYKALVALLFPLVGLILAYQAVKMFLGWRRFGPALFQMNPFPGAIGGDVGGHIDLLLPHDPARSFSVKLVLLLSYTERSGGESEHKQRLIWERRGIAETVSHGGNTRILVRFRVPEDLRPSEMPSERYHLWRLTVEAEMEEVDLSRSYEIPVFATGEKSAEIRQETAETPATFDANYEALGRLLNPVQDNGGTEWFQPVGRSLNMAGFLMLFGATFAGAGIFLAYQHVWLMFPVFLIIGLLVLIGGMYTATNSLFFRVEGNAITRTRRIMGRVVSHQQLDRQDIRGLFMHSNMSSGDTPYFGIYLKLDDAEYVIAEGFQGRAQAELALETIATLTGIPAITKESIRPRTRLPGTAKR